MVIVKIIIIIFIAIIIIIMRKNVIEQFVIHCHECKTEKFLHPFTKRTAISRSTFDTEVNRSSYKFHGRKHWKYEYDQKKW